MYFSEMRIMVSTILVMVLVSGVIAQDVSTLYKVKIFCNDQQLNDLIRLGLDIDHGDYRKDVWFESIFDEEELAIIQKSGMDYEIIIHDVQEYRNQLEFSEQSRSFSNNRNSCSTSNSESFTTPQSFQLGSMGGFLTYQEYLAALDSMFARYPNLITQKDTIDTITSHGNRPIYWVKISDNPTLDEDEPELLYTALHHAREPASMSSVIMYMYYLLENYGSNDEVTYLVDNTEMYFVPMINPDGYYYNQITNPNGGGNWRKNRRDNGDGTVGVDLNRNYGHAWGYDNTGSSPTSSSDTYRGDSAFSEPEVQAVKWLCENRNFKASINYHTYGNLLIYPWGYKSSYYTPDSATFVEFSKVLTIHNEYNYGTGDQTVGYVTNGDSDDWMYGEQNTKNMMLSFTPEAGDSDDGFWPSSNRIIPISKFNLRQNLNLAWLVNKYAIAKDLSPTTISTTTEYLKTSVTFLGLDTTGTYELSLSSLDGLSTITNSPKSYSNQSHLDTKTDSFLVQVNNGIAEGTSLQFLLTLSNGDFSFYDTIAKVYGEPINLIVEQGNNTNNWSTTNSWNITNQDYYSPSYSFTDSPSGNYSNNSSNNYFEFKEPIILTKATNAFIKYYCKWEIEPGYDYVQILASNDNKANWTPLCGKYTTLGTSDQDNGQPLYDGFQQSWVLEEIDLNDFIGDTVYLKFGLFSDIFVNEDGFYFDDFTVKVIGDTVSPPTSTSINVMDSDDWSVYPNPNNGNFIVKSHNQNRANISIYNALGQEIYITSALPSNLFEINNLSQGSYILLIKSENSIIRKQIQVLR